ncbi:MAG: hypothetical protein AABY03_00605 [Nanoarchaeota archaeon]
MSLEVLFLQSFGFSGGSFGNVLSQWEQLGVFTYVLPFLLIFALIFGILQRVAVFKSGDEPNKGINAIIAVATALMALQFNFVPLFFSDIFPKLGVGLAVILVGIIVTGMFTDSNWTWIGTALGAVVFFVIMGNSFEFGTTSFWFWIQQYIGTIIAVAILLILLFVAVGKFPPKFEPRGDSIYARSLKGQ